MNEVAKACLKNLILNLKNNREEIIRQNEAIVQEMKGDRDPRKLLELLVGITIFVKSLTEPCTKGLPGDIVREVNELSLNISQIDDPELRALMEEAEDFNAAAEAEIPEEFRATAAALLLIENDLFDEFVTRTNIEDEITKVQ